jgi:hypothetical protein
MDTPDTKPTQAAAGADSSQLALPHGPAAPLTKPAAETGALPQAPDPKQTSPAPPAPTDWQAKFAEETHQYVREYIRNADQKAGLFLAAATTFLAFLYSKGTSGRWLKAPDLWGFGDMLSFIATAGLAIGAACLLGVVLPRLIGSRRGILFFNAIAEFESAREYSDDVASKVLADCIRTKLQHTWELAQICRQKYQLLRWGCWIAGIGLVFGLLYLAVTRTAVPAGP